MSDFDPAEFIAQQKEAEARRRWHQAQDHAYEARALHARADDKDDTMTVAEAKNASELAKKAHVAASRLVKASNLREDTLVLERIQILQRRLVDFKQALAVHEDYLVNPDEWGGVDMSGQPIDTAQQEQYVKMNRAVIAALEEELRDLETRAPKNKRTSEDD